MADLLGALAGGLAVAVAGLVIGGGLVRPRRAEAWLVRAAGRLAAVEGERARRSGLNLPRAGPLVLEIGAGLSAATLAYLVTGMPALALAGGGLALGLLVGALGLRETALRRARQDAVVAAVRTLRQLLETGAVGVTAALEVLADRGPVELRKEFRAVVAGGGRPAAWAEARARIDEPVFDLLSAAVLVQRPGGGELAPLFKELEEAVTSAYEVEREAAALQVQARSASTLIVCLPLAFLGVMCLLNSPYLDVYRTLPGQLFLGAMLAVMAGGNAVVRAWLRLPAEPRVELVDA